ncbi:MAG: hypothetical protein HZB21_06895 [Deltaproteobacteria bacterium]|nr:hypothetical protein [Deltaproteobacteria bacterium]MBI5810895.1 hypothetical protein [Deltaproteobacteria bacterium]
MRILFDLSGTVFGVMDMSLRPGIKDTIEALRAKGCDVDFWTNGPRQIYAAFLERAGIKGVVFQKGADLPFKPDICIDDEPQEWMPGMVLNVSMYLSEGMQCDVIPASIVPDESEPPSKRR